MGLHRRCRRRARHWTTSGVGGRRQRDRSRFRLGPWLPWAGRQVPVPAVLGLTSAGSSMRWGRGARDAYGVARRRWRPTGPAAEDGGRSRGRGAGAPGRRRAGPTSSVWSWAQGTERTGPPGMAVAPGELASRDDDLDESLMVVLEANVDDLTHASGLCAHGAARQRRRGCVADADPDEEGPSGAHPFCPGPPRRRAAAQDLVLAQTSTIGVRQSQVTRWALARSWVDVDVDGQRIAVKAAHRNGRISNVTPSSPPSWPRRPLCTARSATSSNVPLPPPSTPDSPQEGPLRPVARKGGRASVRSAPARDRTERQEHDERLPGRRF